LDLFIIEFLIKHTIGYNSILSLVNASVKFFWLRHVLP
jgi:hypothetical protein